MEPIEATFAVDKETKNTVRFQEEAEEGEAKVGMLYVQKTALGNPVPRKIKVVIEEA